LVPRWRMMMLPPTTDSPPNFFTPRRRPSESRPLREEPPAFLCAIVLLRPFHPTPRAHSKSAHGQAVKHRTRDFSTRDDGVLALDRRDFDERQILTRATLALAVLASALFERDRLGAPGLFGDLAQNLRARDRRRPDLRRALLRDEQNLVEGDGVARRALERHDGDDVSGGNAILLAAGPDHCEHCLSSCSIPAQTARAPPTGFLAVGPFGSSWLRALSGTRQRKTRRNRRAEADFFLTQGWRRCQWPNGSAAGPVRMALSVPRLDVLEWGKAVHCEIGACLSKVRKPMAL